VSNGDILQWIASSHGNESVEIITMFHIVHWKHTATGEVLPPHFQFSPGAKSDERKHIRIETVRFMKNVTGKFGHDKVKTLPWIN